MNLSIGQAVALRAVIRELYEQKIKDAEVIRGRHIHAIIYEHTLPPDGQKLRRDAIHRIDAEIMCLKEMRDKLLEAVSITPEEYCK